MHFSLHKFFLILALLAGMAGVGAACAHPSFPAAPSSTAAAFGSTQVLGVGKSVRFPDGLIIDLNKINDSRCPAGVQCIWAGELAPELTLHGGPLGRARKVMVLGTQRARERAVEGYAVALIDAGPDSATLVVTKPAVTTPPVTAPPKEDTIRVKAPRPGESVRSPLTVRGRARGPWYFEASFPVTLLDADGAVLAQGQARAQGEWMTRKLVPFTATFAFKAPATATGELLLEKGNPSGEPRNAQALRIPLRFAAANAARGDSGVRGVVTMGPGCPVERMPPDPNCQDKPQAATFSIDTPAGVHIATVTSAADGSFSARLPVGTYVISLQSMAAMPSMAPHTFNVAAHAYAELRLRMDSGIR